MESDSLKKYGFENPFDPDPLLIKGLDFIQPKGIALDIGCGEGADSAFLSKKGCEVFSLDNNDTYLNKLQSFVRDHKLNISIDKTDVITYDYQPMKYDIINCLLVGCCMRRSEFEYMMVPVKQSVKVGGIVVMSLRNYLDPQYLEYEPTEPMIEPNTFVKKDNCCEIRYYIEKNRLKELFLDFEILHYYEGMIPDKYQEIVAHGDSQIVCRRIKK